MQLSDRVLTQLCYFAYPLMNPGGVKVALGGLQPGRPVLKRLQRQEPLVQQIKGVAD